MHNFNVINKGEYQHKQTSEALKVSRFLVLRGKHCRYLLLDFENTKDNMLTGISLQIDQYDARGNSLGAVDVAYSDLKAKKGKFVLKEKIKLHYACADFFIKVVYAEYGEYKYRLGKNGTFAVYDKKVERAPITKESVKKDVGKDGHSFAQRMFSKPAFITFFAIVMMCLLIGATVVQLELFKKDEKTFFLSNVEYEFIADKEDGSEVQVIGYVGRGGGDLVIPEEVEGHPVAKIKKGSFKNNELVKSIKISGAVYIEASAFEGCKNLTEVKITDMVRIGNKAFKNCANLQTVEIASANQIGNQAFYGCKNLKTVKLPSAVNSIGDEVFRNCSSLESITLPDQMESIGEDVLKGCSSLKSLSAPYFGETEEVVETVGYLFGAYDYNRHAEAVPAGLEKITLTKQTTIPEGTFYGLKKLKEVNLPSGVTSIDDYAFAYCHRLKKLTIPAMVTSISPYAFLGNYRLHEIENKSSAIDLVLGEGVAKYALSVYSSPDDKPIKSESSGYEFIHVDGVWYLTDSPEGGTLSLPSSIAGEPYAIPSCFFYEFEADHVKVTGSTFQIQDFAFNNTKIKEISFLSGSHVLGKEVFANNQLLTSINLYDSYIEKIPDRTFANNYVLKTLSMSYGTNEFSVNALSSCSSLQTLSISPALIEIKDETFSYLQSLKEVNFNGNSVMTKIGRAAFANCTRLASGVTIPSSVIEIGDQAFASTSIKSLSIPTSVQTIGRGIVENCAALVDFTVPYIGKTASENAVFGYFFSAEAYGVPYALNITVLNEDVLFDGAFRSFSGTKSITVNGNFNKIGNSTFENCHALNKLSIPSTITEIGSHAFYNCQSLAKFNFVSGLIKIGNNAFQNCYALTSVSLPATVQSIGEYSFDNCSSLTSITLSNNINAISNYAFSNCSTLTSLSLPASIKVVGDGAFSGDSAIKTLELNRVQAIGANAFYGLYELKELTIPSYVNSIGDYAFASCSNLEVVYLKSDASIGYATFENCRNLHEVYNLAGKNLTVGSEDNGMIAFYAVVVNTSSSASRLQVYEDSGKKYKYNSQVCALVKYTGNQSSLVLDSVVIDGKTFNGYSVMPFSFSDSNSLRKLTIKQAVGKIRPYAFINLSIETVIFDKSSLDLDSNLFGYVTNVVFDSSLRGMDTYTFYGVDRYCYNGTESSWNSNPSKNNFAYSPYYFYKDCFHSWDSNNYNWVDGEINFNYQPYEVKDRVEPTCTKGGSYVEYCDTCGYSNTVYLEAYGHDYSYNSNYYCNTCNSIKPFTFNKETKSNASQVVTISGKDDFNEFTNKKPSELVSINVEPTSVSFIELTAKRDLKMQFVVNFSDVEIGKVTIKVNDEQVKEIIPTEDILLDGELVKLSLKANDKVTITFERSETEDASAKVSVGTIKIS